MSMHAVNIHMTTEVRYSCISACVGAAWMGAERVTRSKVIHHSLQVIRLKDILKVQGLVRTEEDFYDDLGFELESSDSDDLADSDGIHTSDDDNSSASSIDSDSEA